MHRLFVSMSAALAAAVLLVAGVSGSAPGGSLAATPEPRPDGGPPPTVIVTPEPRPSVPAGFATPPPATTPEPRPDGGPGPIPTPCAGGERMGCLPAVPTPGPTPEPRG